MKKKTPDFAHFICLNTELLENGRVHFLPTTRTLEVPFQQWASWLQHLEDNVAAYEVGHPEATVCQLQGFEEGHIRVHVDVVRSWIKDLQKLMEQHNGREQSENVRILRHTARMLDGQ